MSIDMDYISQGYFLIYHKDPLQTSPLHASSISLLPHYFPLPDTPLPTPTHHSHNAQLTKAVQHILIHATQPLLLKRLLTPRSLNRLLQVLADEDDEIESVHGVRVDEVALAYVLWGFGLGGVVGLRGPEERAKGRALVRLLRVGGARKRGSGERGKGYVLLAPVVHSIE